jgi:cell division protein ZapA (FtsZ GTPase activity inhibitor)
MSEQSSLDEVVEMRLLGEHLRVRCEAKSKKEVEEAILKLQNKSAAILRANPSLTPLQVALMIALENERYEVLSKDVNSPFLKQAQKKMQKSLYLIERTLKENHG